MSTITVATKELKEGWHVVIECDVMGKTSDGNPIAIVVGPMPRLVCNLYAPWYAAAIAMSNKVTVTDEVRDRLASATQALGGGAAAGNMSDITRMIDTLARLNEPLTPENMTLLNNALRED